MNKLLLTPALALGLVAPSWAQDVSPDMRALIPMDATALVRMDSLQDLESTVQTLAALIGPGLEDELTLENLFSSMPPDFDPTWIDITQPWAIAVGKVDPMSGAEPAFCVLIPANDPQAIASALASELPSYRVTGSYLGLSSAEGMYPNVDPNSPLLDRLPDGAIAGLIDLRPTLDEVGPMLKMFIGMGRGQMMSELQSDPSMPAPLRALSVDGVNYVFDMAEDVVESVTELTFSLDMQGTLASTDIRIGFAPGSPIAELHTQSGPRFSTTRRFMDVNAPVSQAQGFDLSWLSKSLRPYVDEILDAVEGEGGQNELGMPQEMFRMSRTALDRGMDVMGNFGNGFTASTFIDDRGMSMGGWLQGVKGDELAGSLMALFEVELAGLVGLELTTVEITESTRRMSLDFNPKTLAQNFGLSDREYQDLVEMKQLMMPQPIEVSTTTVGDQTLFIVNGSRNTITQALQSAKDTSRQVSPMLDRIEGLLGDSYPFSAAYYNVGEYIAGMGTFMSGMDPYSGGAPTSEELARLESIEMPAATYAGFDGTSLRSGAQIDVRDLGKLIELMTDIESSRMGSPPVLEAVPLEPARER